MASPDIPLGPGDTAPITRLTFRNPNQDDGSPGDPIDITGATVTVKYQNRNGTTPWVVRTPTIVPAPAVGDIDIDWLATGGPVPPGDYDLRAIAVLSSGHQITVPNGAKPGDPITEEFLWMHVARDFVVVP